MTNVKSTLKRFIARLLYYSGLLWLYAATKLRGRAFVLMYHRVLPVDNDSFSANGIVVTPATFATQLSFLRRHFNPLSAEQFRSCLTRGYFPRGSCLVTFDDGWHDNASHALPILERFQIPAILFVATAYVGTDVTFWQERLSRQLFRASRMPSGPGVLQPYGIANACEATAPEARRIIRTFIDRLKGEGTAAIARLEAALAAKLDGAHMPDIATMTDALMDWAQVRQMQASGLVTIGSHAHSHVPLTQLSYADCVSDLRTAARILADNCLPAPWLVAYPNGDFDNSVMAAAQEVGVSVAFTTVPGTVGPGDDPMRLQRINIHESATRSAPEFLCRILGLF